ncbi:MAG TPA: carboxypeptidase-like regulatory domain-containing protein [Bryobacteraceae bacterium]|nr:carboxypeptidase-like regulatory domain-containing protein [Bryobacteraceae bacterium]
MAGTILDATGAAVPSATVTVKHQATGNVRTAITDDSGTYSIPNLAVGAYDVTVAKQGFAELHVNNVQLTVAQNLTLNESLEVGGTKQTVEVVGSTLPAINFEDAEISNIVDSKRIEDLPLITRDPYSLVLLSPGTLQIPNDSLGGFSINGQRERNNNFLLDGVDNNDAGVPGAPNGVSSINPDSTQEFRVITNNFLPEFGRNTGAIVDIVTRSGSNDFHGDAYEFNRVNAMAARDFFNPSPSAGQPADPQNPFVRNQFGASLGGPIVKDKTFFFVNAEWDRFRTTLTNNAVVPTAAFKSGIFSYDGQQINLASPSSPNNALGLPLDPTMQKIFSLYPNPNGPLLDSIRGIYYFPTATPQNTANVTFRLDQRIGEKYTLSARYIYNGDNVANSLDEIVPGIGGVAQTGQTHNGAVNFVAAFRPDLVNEFSAGLNKSDVLFSCNGHSLLDQTGPLDQFGFGTDYSFAQSTGVPTISSLGCIALGDSNSQFRRFGTWSLVDHLTWVKGRHTIKVGGEFRYVFENGYDAFGSRPTVDFTAFGNFGIPIVNCSGACGSDELLQTMAAALLGVPGIQSQTQFFNAGGTRTATDYRLLDQHEQGYFAQDSWKIRNNLTMELGMRYEFDGVPFERNGNLSNLLYQQANATPPITFQTVGPGTGRQIYRDDYKDFEPRVGLAWDPFSDGKTSVRIGYGIFHDRIFGNLFGNLRADPPFEAPVQNLPNLNFATGVGPLVTLSSLPPPVTQPAPSASVPDGTYASGIVLLDPNLRTPYTQSWNVGVQRDLSHGMTFEVNYVGSSSHDLIRSVDANPPLPWLVAAAQANGTLPTDVSGGDLRYLPLLGLPQVTGNTAFVEPILIKSVGNATYDGLQLTFRKRFGYGLDFQAAYTWSHAIDDSNDPLVAPGGDRNIARDSFDLQEDRGSSDFDLRHRLIVNWLYELPVGAGHAHFNHGVAARAFGGWELAGLSTFQSGHPYDIFSSRDSQYTGLTNRPDLVGNPAIPAGSPRTQVGPPISAFAVQPFGRQGTLGRNTFTGPTFFDTDVTLIKNTKLTEKMNLQFRAEVYNLFNRIEFLNPDASGDTLSNPGTFGQAVGTIVQPDGTTSARQIQLALKLIF